jgi:hypothetical protein
LDKEYNDSKSLLQLELLLWNWELKYLTSKTTYMHQQENTNRSKSLTYKLHLCYILWEQIKKQTKMSIRLRKTVLI